MDTQQNVAQDFFEDEAGRDAKVHEIVEKIQDEIEDQVK